MYHYLQDKEFERRIRRYGGEIMQQLCHNLKVDHDIGAQFYLVGSGARNLITQNENLPVDLDYNLEIIRCDDFDDGKTLKECARKAFDNALRQRNQWNCQDSTSTLTSRQIRLDFTSPLFSIDVCITCQDEDGCHHRLIHEKTGWISNDKYYWNKAPQSRRLREKAEYIRKNGRWEQVREQYLHIKNLRLSRGETKEHPSFTCYAEAVSNVYNTRGNWK
jgi:hypothetical protein